MCRIGLARPGEERERQTALVGRFSAESDTLPGTNMEVKNHLFVVDFMVFVPMPST